MPSRPGSRRAYDRTAACEFTSFLGCEYTNTSGVSNLHRNVIFASDVVPDKPISYFEEPDPAGLLGRLRAECREGAAPQFAVQARLDPGTAEEPGAPLEQIQIIKGWVSADGTPSERVVTAVGGVGEVGEGPDIDPGTCEPMRQGAETLCEVWEDPDFDPTADAFYYARVVEVPTRRWSRRLCNELADPKPEASSDETVAKTVQQRAWSSPIWFFSPSRSALAAATHGLDLRVWLGKLGVARLGCGELAVLTAVEVGEHS